MTAITSVAGTGDKAEHSFSNEAQSSSAAAADLHAIFGPEGVLARDLSAYRFRPQQLAMAEAIALAIETRGQLLA